jgi:hypothetical protein
MTLISIIQCDLDYKVINTLQEKINIDINIDNLSNFRLCGLDIVNENDNLIKIIKYVDKHLLFFVEKRDSYLLLAINNYIIFTNLIYSIKKNNNLSYLLPSQIIDHLNKCKLLFNKNIERYNNLSFNNLDFIENWDKKIINN